MNIKNILLITLTLLAAILSFFSNEPFNDDILRINFFNTFIFSFLIIVNNNILLPKGAVKFTIQLKEFTGLLKWKNKRLKYFIFLTPLCLSLPFLLKKSLTEFTIVFALLFLQNIITFLILSRFDFNKSKTIISNFLMLFLVIFIIANKYNIFVLKFISYLIGATTTFDYFISDSIIEIKDAVMYGFIIVFIVIGTIYLSSIILNHILKRHKI